MLGCLMCTATETALWTLGVTSFFMDWQYRFVSHAISVMAGKPVALPIGVELLLAAAAAFALSLAVAGEAWGIKNVMENRDEKFLKLRKEFRENEAQLREKIAELERQVAAGGHKIEYDLG